MEREKKLFKANCLRNLSLCDNLVEQLILLSLSLSLVGWWRRRLFVLAEHVHHLFIEHFPKVNPSPSDWAKLHTHTQIVLIGSLIESFQLQNAQLQSLQQKAFVESGRPDAIIYDRIIFSRHQLN